mgnify:CR=1 FL=1
MKAYVVADPKIAKTVYSIFDKKELAKYIEFFVKNILKPILLLLIPAMKVLYI